MELDVKLKLLVCKYPKAYFRFISHLKAAALANDLSSFVAKMLLIYILCSVCPDVYRSVASLSQAVSDYMFAFPLWATVLIFEAHSHAPGPGFISIPSNQSSVHIFPHKPFCHTRMAYIQP